MKDLEFYIFEDHFGVCFLMALTNLLRTKIRHW